MKKYVFRTSAGPDIGIGHLVRCVQLAKEISRFGGECLFLFDHLPDRLESFLSGFEYKNLYEFPQCQIDSEHDADIVSQFLGYNDWVILDDYKIHEDWERALKRLNDEVKLCVIDDLERPHVCDVLIDPGSRGEESRHQWPTRVPESCITLLGPDYALLADSYQGHGRKEHFSEPFTILLNLGGGGDLTILEGIVDEILKIFEGSIRINVLVGPLATGRVGFVQKYNEERCVNCLTDAIDAFPVLQEADFYIGSAGTMLLQARSLQIPALTLSLAPNQSNNVFNLEEIGHYFHLNSWNQKDFTKIARFAKIIRDHYDVIQDMSHAAKIQIDGFGSQRITSWLMMEQKIQVPSTKKMPYRDTEILNKESLGKSHTIRPVINKDINLYRVSRNLDSNHRFMTLSSKIPAIDHYCWWFTNDRESFVVEKEGDPSLIIWHQSVNVDGQEFISAGWFVCDEDSANFIDVLLAMKWQIKYCREHHAGKPWLSVAHKKNKFAKQVDDYFGFEEMDNIHPYFEACSKMFPAATQDEFYYIVYEEISRKI